MTLPCAISLLRATEMQMWSGFPGGRRSSVTPSLLSGRVVCGKRAREADRILAQLQVMSYNDGLKASAIGNGAKAGLVLTALRWDYVRCPPCWDSPGHLAGTTVLPGPGPLQQQPVLLCLP